MLKILIIEDDIAIWESLKLYLSNSNFEVLLYTTWVDANNFIDSQAPDILILDINLPWKNGINICKDLREKSDIPVIMLTARNSELDKVTWLEIWADDYIAKPFSPRELLARINSIVRRIDGNAPSPHIIQSGWVTLDLDKSVVIFNDVETALTSHEYWLLKKILEWKWNLITRESLMKEVMGYDNYIMDRTLDTHIKNLRRKIWDSKKILTVRWIWYRLNV